MAVHAAAQDVHRPGEQADPTARMMPEESPVHAAVRRARAERARARGEVPLYEPAAVSDRAPYVPYGSSGGKSNRYAAYGTSTAADDYGVTSDTRMLPTAGIVHERSPTGGSNGQVSSMLQVQGMQLSSLQRETEATRRAVQSEVDSVKVRVVDLEERVQEVEHACRDAIGRCASEMTAISTALSARRSLGASNSSEHAALLGERNGYGGAYDSYRSENIGVARPIKAGSGARPPPPPVGFQGDALYPSPGPLTPMNGGSGNLETGRPASASAEDDADARALLRGFARGRVVWHNNWSRDFWFYVRCYTPVVASFTSHPCSPYRRWQFALIALARFGFLSWLVYNGASGRPYGQWIIDVVSPWATYRERWPAGMSDDEQRASLSALFTSDRTMVGIHLGIFFAVSYQLLLIHLAVPPRFLPTRPELFFLLALGGVSALCVMISEATIDKANGGIVIALLLYAEVICQLTALLVDLLGFQVISSVQMQMLLNRQLSRGRAREQLSTDPELAHPSAQQVAPGRGLAAGSHGGNVSSGGTDDEADEADEGGTTDDEPLTGPDRAHPSARCCSANSLYSKAYPYDLRYPRTPYLVASWKLTLAEVAEMVEAKAAADASSGTAHGRTPETNKVAKRGANNGGAVPKRQGMLDWAAEYLLEHSTAAKERAAAGQANGAHKPAK